MQPHRVAATLVGGWLVAPHHNPRLCALLRPVKGLRTRSGTRAVSAGTGVGSGGGSGPGGAGAAAVAAVVAKINAAAWGLPYGADVDTEAAGAGWGMAHEARSLAEAFPPARAEDPAPVADYAYQEDYSWYYSTPQAEEPVLPPGWTKEWDLTYQAYYYYFAAESRSSWDPPLA